MKTFRTAGDLGDAVYSLAIVKALGGGELFWHRETWTKVPMTAERWEHFAKLADDQLYVITNGEWNRAVDTDYNLNDFRALYFRAIKERGGLKSPRFPAQKNLLAWMCEAHGVPEHKMGEPWLSVEPCAIVRVVINRTCRYRNHHFPWARVCAQLPQKETGFLGDEQEHAAFVRDAKFNCPRITTPSLLHAARVIAGSDLFIGNQSACYAIAEGLKHPAVQEVCPWLPNCLFNRPNCWHGWDESIVEKIGEALCSNCRT